MPKFEENALYVGGKCSKKLAMLKKILMLFMSENAKNYAGLFYRWLATYHDSLCKIMVTVQQRFTIDLLLKPTGSRYDMKARYSSSSAV